MRAANCRRKWLMFSNPADHAQLENPFGHHWWVATHARDLSKQELFGFVG